MNSNSSRGRQKEKKVKWRITRRPDTTELAQEGNFPQNAGERCCYNNNQALNVHTYLPRHLYQTCIQTLFIRGRTYFFKRISKMAPLQSL